MTRKFWIDTDTASDDAVALLMAFRYEGIEIVGVSCVAGNIPVEQAVRNALIVADLCGVDVPVYQGAPKPLMRPYRDAKSFHGEDGLGDAGFTPSQRRAESQHAVNALIDAFRAHGQRGDKITLVTLGPLTNIALALSLAPDIIAHVERCVVMGGAAATFGNVTPAAEYNIWCDPEAARIVFHSGMSVQMVGWEFCIGEYALNQAEIDALRAFNTPYADFTIDCNATLIKAYHKQTGMEGISLPDPVALACALEPSIATTVLHHVDIECASDLTRGMTVVDKLDESDNEYCQGSYWDWIRANTPPVIVTWDVDIARWKALLFSLLR